MSNRITMTQGQRRLINHLLDYFYSAYVCMLVLGGLSEMLVIPRLAIGYIPTLLIMIFIREATPYGLYNPLVYLFDNKDKTTEI